MDTDKQAFKRNLDELIKLFRKLKDKTSIENMPGVDKAMYQNFEIFLSSYDNMKVHITDDLYNQFGVPMRKMIADLVTQLKSELSEEDIIELEDSKEVKEIKDVEILRDVKEIDLLLKNPKLSPEEIDKLLDERSSLK